MVRGGTIFAGVAALLLGLGGCHLIFGHEPGSSPAGADGRPRVDGRFRDGQAAEIRIGEGGLVDRIAPRDRVLGGESVVFPPDQGPPPCDPAFGWCLQQVGTAHLRDVWATDDGSLAYAVGDEVALLRLGGNWKPVQTTPALPAANWRGVHMISSEAWLVGNLLTGEPAAYSVHFSSLKALKISTQNVPGQILNAIWMTSPAAGWAAATTPTGGGVIDKVGSSGLESNDSTGSPCTSVSQGGSNTWAAASSLEIKHRDAFATTWGFQNLTGVPSGTTFTGVMAIGSTDYVCGSGHTTTAAIAFCCLAKGACHAVALPGAKFHAVAAFPVANDARLWLVGEIGSQGVIVSANATLSQLEVKTPTLEAYTPLALRGVWVSPNGKQVIAVGDKGTILQRQYP